MNIVDDADGPLDPRIQIELEKLNNATDDINKLEIEFDEAKNALNYLITESTVQLREIISKLGPACIDKAKCYFEAAAVQEQARIKCQEMARNFQKESVVHAAAKETVALAETHFLSHQDKWNFDQAWQDMLNHATIKVMEAENSKAACAREHQKWTALFHDAEKKVQQLEEKYKRSIMKAKPYFEIKDYYDQKIPIENQRVDCLRKSLKKAKTSYAESLRALEEISNEIHKKRRDYDILVNGPREPGVGAELENLEETLNYQEQLNKVTISRVNSVASSEADLEDRAQDFEDVLDLKQRVDQLNSRSADGSETTSNQWEVELQASIEKVNKLPYESNNACVFEPKTDTITKNEELEKVTKNNQNDRKKQFDDFYQGWQSLTQSPINSFINKSKNAFKNSFSKSLTSSPVSMGSFSFGRNKIMGTQDNKQLNKNEGSLILENNINKTDISKDSLIPDETNTQRSLEKSKEESLEKLESQTKSKINDTPVQSKSKEVHSLNSSPVKVNYVDSSIKEYKKNIETNKSDCLVTKTKELPLLSFFQKSTTQKPTIDKSCSMINLNEKQNLKSMLGNSDLSNIQAISVERLANARHKLVGDF